jgi:hypothetical protein
MPLHFPSVPHCEVPSSMQIPRGSLTPGGTIVHNPGVAPRLQVRQAPVHSSLQQTPSTHWPLSQSGLLVQEAPIGFRPQLRVAVSQVRPATQSMLPMQTLLQPPVAPQA